MSMNVRASLVAAVALCAAPLSAAVIEVDSDGAGYTTIQDGLNAAATGDIVRVLPGTYTGALNRALDFQGKALLLESSAGPGETVIDCENADRAFFFHTMEDTASVVSGFRVRNGSAAAGGAAAFLHSTAKFVDMVFVDNSATDYGGAIYTESASPFVLESCMFTGNVSTGSGGALYAGYATDARIRGCSFVGNQSSGWAGAILSYSGSSVTLRSCLIEDNVSLEGGGIYCKLDSSVSLVETAILSNLAAQSGGGGVYCDQGCRAALDRCSLIGNGASGSQAGGIRFFQSGPSSVTNCTLADNVAGYRGGAIECSDADSVTITNCTLIGNSGNAGAGGIYLYHSSPVIANTIIAFSAAGEAVLCDQGTENPTITHCVVYANAGGDSLCGDYHDNAYEDPLFCDMPNGDLTLCANSPCLPGATWPERVGAHDQGCSACGSAVEPASWGRIKSLYR
jgi:predicted outer membrane repeat protein